MVLSYVRVLITYKVFKLNIPLVFFFQLNQIIFICKMLNMFAIFLYKEVVKIFLKDSHSFKKLYNSAIKNIIGEIVNKYAKWSDRWRKIEGEDNIE